MQPSGFRDRTVTSWEARLSGLQGIAYGYHGPRPKPKSVQISVMAADVPLGPTIGTVGALW